MTEKTKEELKELLYQGEMFHTWGTLLACGTPILDCLETLAETFPRYESFMKTLHDDIMVGRKIAYRLNEEETPFHPFAKTFINVGEETGALDLLLYKLSSHLELEVETHKKDIDPRAKEEMVFYFCLATAIDAGLPIVGKPNESGLPTGVLSLVSQYSPFPPKEVMDDVISKVSGGSSTLAEAFGAHPEYFPKIAVKMVEAGEIGGVLDSIMNRYARYVEKMFRIEHELDSIR